MDRHRWHRFNSSDRVYFMAQVGCNIRLDEPAYSSIVYVYWPESGVVDVIKWFASSAAAEASVIIIIIIAIIIIILSSRSRAGLGCCIVRSLSIATQAVQGRHLECNVRRHCVWSWLVVEWVRARTDRWRHRLMVSRRAAGCPVPASTMHVQRTDRRGRELRRLICTSFCEISRFWSDGRPSDRPITDGRVRRLRQTTPFTQHRPVSAERQKNTEKNRFYSIGLRDYLLGASVCIVHDNSKIITNGFWSIFAGVGHGPRRGDWKCWTWNKRTKLQAWNCWTWKCRTWKCKSRTADTVIVVIAVYYSNFIHSMSMYQIIWYTYMAKCVGTILGII